MGAGASVGADGSISNGNGSGGSGSGDAPSQFDVSEVTLRKLPDAVEEAVYGFEKFPCVVDPSEQVCVYVYVYVYVYV
jgi:hypothetical protein